MAKGNRSRKRKTKKPETDYSSMVIFGISGIVLLLCSNLGIHYFAGEPKAKFWGYDPCCGYPCLNQGVCMTLADGNYTCDCTYTGYYGTNCDIPTWYSWLANWKLDAGTMQTFLTSYDWFWDILNNIRFIRVWLLAHVYLSFSDFTDSPPTFESDHHYITFDAMYNKSFYDRALPPVPGHCPTPMGVKGLAKLPNIDSLIKKVFTRREFIPDPHDSNLLFQYYGQHFTQQFFWTDTNKSPQLTTGTGEMDVSNIYGRDEQERQALRSGCDGKLRSQILQGDEFPPYLTDDSKHPNKPISENQRFAVPFASFSWLPGLFVYVTIWLREHNRVCDELLKVHHNWDDEQLYQTARLIITGEVIKITIEDYIQHLTQYKLKLTFEPELLSKTQFQFHNRIQAEFKYLFDWHPLVPDVFEVNGMNYLFKAVTSLEPIFKHGFDKFVQSMIKTRAGAITAQNYGNFLYPFLKEALQTSRQLRFQGINAYRKRFGLDPFTSFENMTGETRIAQILEAMYGNIDAVEYYVGLFVEQPGPSVTTLSMVNMGGAWSIKSLFSNPVCNPLYWKPSTFGGEVGWNIIQNASLEKLFCLNMRNGCQYISFKVPPNTP